MPRFKVVKVIPARYQEVYIVDAAGEEEAERIVRSGRARCKLRDFTTTPGAALPAGTLFRVLGENAPVGGDFAYPSGHSGSKAEFANAHFLTTPGDNQQQVVQEFGE